MTVEELIAILQTQPKDRKVRVRDFRGHMKDANEAREQRESLVSDTKYLMIFSD